MSKDNETGLLTPGAALKAKLKEVGKTQKHFADDMGMRPSHISEMLSNKRPVSMSIASKIEILLGLPAKDLLDLQTAYNMNHCNEAEEFSAGDILSDLDQIICLKDLFGNNAIRNSQNTEKLAFLQMEYGILSADQVISSCGFFKKSETTGLDSRKLRTWLLISHRELKRSESASGKFNSDTLDEVKEKLRDVFHENINTINKVKSILSNYGIKFVIVPKLDHASVDGYSCFDESGNPAIIVTLRYQRIDNLAFGVMHEVYHVYKHLKAGGEPRLTIDNYEESNRKEEKEANAFAADALIPDSIWRKLPYMPINPFAIQKKSAQWAEANHLNKWIVLGRISHETGMYKFKQDDSRSIN